MITLGVDDRQAATVDGDAIAWLGRGEEGVRQGKASTILFPGAQAHDLSSTLNKPRKHLEIKRGL
jgi:hypothetical protein